MLEIKDDKFVINYNIVKLDFGLNQYFDVDN